MITWVVSIITAILLLFIVWRTASRSFRERAERPKIRFLESLGLQPSDESESQDSSSKENHHEKRNP